MMTLFRNSLDDFIVMDDLYILQTGEKKIVLTVQSNEQGESLASSIFARQIPSSIPPALQG